MPARSGPGAMIDPKLGGRKQVGRGQGRVCGLGIVICTYGGIGELVLVQGSP